MQSNHEILNQPSRAGLALVALLLGSVGCGSAETEVESEPILQSTQALGSSKPREDISEWGGQDGLTSMVSDGNYRLTADINASGQTWTPMAFSGTFDGNGRTISNLTINVAGDAGFFSYLSTAIVRNVKFTNLSVTGTWVVGGLAAWSQESAVDRVVVEGTVIESS